MNEVNASRSALIEVGLRQFGALGFEGASVRAIAQAANTPISAITYHFESKQGLYLACAQHISDIIGSLMSASLIATEIEAGAADAVARARAGLLKILSDLTNAIVQSEIESVSRFIMREQADPTEAFGIIYGGVMGKVIARISALLTTLSHGRLASLDVKVRALAIMGEVMAFRVARAAVMRTTGWSEIGAAEVVVIRSVILDHVSAILDKIERETGE